MGRSPSSSPLTTSPPPPSSAPSRRSGRVPKPAPNPEQLLASPTAAKFSAPKPMEQPSASTASAKPRLKGYDLDYKDREKGKKRPTTDNPTPWRHPDEFPFVNRADWSQDLMMEYIRYHSFSVPPRDSPSSIQLIPILLWGSLPPSLDPTDESTSPVVWLPRGYRVPLMFIAKFQWDSLRIVLNAPDPKADWEAFKFNILHLSRLCQHLFQQAREARRKALLAVDVSQDKAVLKALLKGEKDRAVLGGFDKNWRCPAFDRLLTRFYNKWFLSTDEWLENFFNEFDEEEYHEQDVVKHDWIRWAFKGHKGFVLTKDEVQNGITAEQYMWGLNKVPDGDDGKFKWLWDDARKPPQNAVSGWFVPGSTSTLDPVSVQVKREIVEHAMARDFEHARKSKLDLDPPTLALFNEITNPPKSLTAPPARALPPPAPPSPIKIPTPNAGLSVGPSASGSGSGSGSVPPPKDKATSTQLQPPAPTATTPATIQTTANGQSGEKRGVRLSVSMKARRATASASASTSTSAGRSVPAFVLPKGMLGRRPGTQDMRNTPNNGKEKEKQVEGTGAVSVKRKRKRAEVEGEAGSLSDAGRSKRKRQSPVFKLQEVPDIRVPKKFYRSSNSSEPQRRDNDQNDNAGSMVRSSSNSTSNPHSDDSESGSQSGSGSGSESESQSDSDSDSESESESEEEEDDVRKDKSYRPQWGGLRNKQIPGTLSNATATSTSTSINLKPKQSSQEKEKGKEKEKNKQEKEKDNQEKEKGKGKDKRKDKDKDKDKTKERTKEKEKEKGKERESSRGSTAAALTPSTSFSLSPHPPPAKNGDTPSQAFARMLVDKKTASLGSGSPSATNGDKPFRVFHKAVERKPTSSSVSASASVSAASRSNSHSSSTNALKKTFSQPPYPGAVPHAMSTAAGINATGVSDADIPAMNSLQKAFTNSTSTVAGTLSNMQNASPYPHERQNSVRSTSVPNASGVGAPSPKATTATMTTTTTTTPMRFRLMPTAGPEMLASTSGTGHNSDAEMNEIEATMTVGDYGGADSPSSFDIASSAPSEDNDNEPSGRASAPGKEKPDGKAVHATRKEMSVDERMEVDDVGTGPSAKAVAQSPPRPQQPKASPDSASASASVPQAHPQPESVGLLMSQGNRAKSLHTILLLRDLLQFLRVPGWGNLREVFERRGRGIVPGSGMPVQTQTQPQGQGQPGLLDDEEVMTVDQRLDILAHASVAMAQVLFPFRGEELSNKIDSLDHRLQQQFDLLWKPEDRPPVRSAESLKKAFEDKEVQTVLIEALSKEIQTMQLEEERPPTPEPVPPRCLASQETQTAEPVVVMVEVTETGVQTDVDNVERPLSVNRTRPRSNSGDAIMADGTVSTPPLPVAGPSTIEPPKASTSNTEPPTPTAKAMMSIMRNIANLLELDDGAAVTKSVKGKEREMGGTDVGGTSTDIGSSSVVVDAIVSEFKAMKEELREIQQKTHEEFESLTTIHRSEVESLKNELRSRDDRGKDELELIQQQHREELEHLRETIRTMVREKEEKKTEMEEENRIPALQLLELRQRIASLENRTRADASETMASSVVGSPSVSQFSDHRASATFHPLGHLLSQDFEDVMATPSVVASPASRHFVRENSTPNPGTPASTGNPISNSSRHEEEESTSNASIPFPIKSQRKMHIMMFPRSSVG